MRSPPLRTVVENHLAKQAIIESEKRALMQEDVKIPSKPNDQRQAPK